MTHRAPLLLLALSLTGLPALPLAAQGWWEAEGWGEIGVRSGTGDEDFYFGGNATWRTTAPGLGLELGAYGEAGSVHDTYAALTYEFANGDRLAFGDPRPAYDSFARPVLSDVFLSAALERSEIGMSRATDGAITENDYQPYGAALRMDGAAVSLHYVEETEAAILGVGGEWLLGGWGAETALELTDDGDSEVNAKFQLARGIGPGEFSAALFYNDANDASTEMEFAYRHTLGGMVEMTELVSIPVDETEEALAVVGARIATPSVFSLDLAAGIQDGDGLASAGLRLDF
ncbi:hypothetical protein [Celeribacter indicus]|uniref:Porin domain-containing protein n=1 Tax=Celeribacter indicus TaxID=1208324 RepID=A0A0B5E096_9RHOB|nr:hypothetical protein [Celeribacter indicus]AJE46426.1 hypothetical protein P73_1711 [Celeribacter indicus]SDW56397.1 hypothetical protein SAMN05443573_104267 [Celeribacter indicus]